MGAPPVLDPTVLESLRQLTPPGEPDVLKELLTLFLEDVPGRIEKLRAAWQAGDAVGVQRSAHSIKGSAGNIGATELYGVCSRIDAQGRSGDLAPLGPMVESLDAEFAKVTAEIQELIK
jgi:HPt (histidine-containing phosphotransfer) domain-containing protein